MVSTGTATNVAVTRTYYYRKKTPKNNCKHIKYVESGKKEAGYQNEYNSKLCYEMCVQEHLIIPVCNCSDPIMAFYEDLNPNYKFCSDMASLRCVETQKELLESNEEAKRNCSNRCPLECDSIMYESTISGSDYPTEYYKTILMQHDLIKENINPKYQYDPEKLNENQIKVKSAKKSKKKRKSNEIKPNIQTFDLKNNVLMISVYYSSLYKTIIQETELVTLETLVGIIGGQLGLCIGVSFLSLAETCEMILSLIKVFVVNLFKKIF